MRRLQLTLANLQTLDLRAEIRMRRLQLTLANLQTLDLDAPLPLAGPHLLQVPLAFANLGASRLAGQDRLAAHSSYRSRQCIRAEVRRVFTQDLGFQRFKVGTRGGRSTKCMTSRGIVGRAVQEVPVLARRASEVDEARHARHANQQIPVLKDRQLKIERARPLQRFPRHQNRMERNVVVEEEDRPIEVPAVREAPAALPPTARTRFVADDGRIAVGDIHAVAEHRSQALQVFRRQQVIVVQETDAVASHRLHTGLRRGRPTSILREVNATHFEWEVLRHFGAPATVVYENDLYVPVGTQCQTVQCLRQPPGSVVRPDHDRHPARRRDCDQRRCTAQVRDKLSRTSGGEVAGSQLAVALGVAA